MSAPLPDGRSVGILGCGNLGTAITRGLLAAGQPPERVHVSTLRPDGALSIAAETGVIAHRGNGALVRAADVVVLSVKPGSVAEACRGIRRDLDEDTVVITVAAGIPTAVCREALKRSARVGRAMPNVAARVRRATTALWLPPEVPEADRAVVRAVFAAVGEVVDLPDEGLFDVATALVGSGPAFVCVLVEALADGAVREGLPRAQALALAASTVAGTGALVHETGEHPAIWKDRVTSPGGTTAAGLHAMESGGFRAAAIEAIAAATRRARELGGKR